MVAKNKQLTRKQRKRAQKKAKKQERKQSPSVTVERRKPVSLQNVAWECYNKHGRGLCLYAEGFPFLYALPPHPFIAGDDLELVNTYDPKKSLVFSYPVNFENDSWISAVMLFSHELASTSTILVPKDKRLSEIVDQFIVKN